MKKKQKDEEVVYEIDGLRFVQTSVACPEQYDVFYGNMKVAYVRLRWGYLIAEIPKACGVKIYEYHFENDWKGEFENEEERQEFLKIIARMVNAMVEFVSVVAKATFAGRIVADVAKAVKESLRGGVVK